MKKKRKKSDSDRAGKIDRKKTEQGRGNKREKQRLGRIPRLHGELGVLATCFSQK